MDDIGAAGTKKRIETVGEKLREIEKRKKFKFDTEKTRYMVIKGRNEKEEMPEITARKGKIEKIDEYKYWGNQMNSKGQIEEIERRTEGMIKEIKKIAKEELIGRMSTEAVALII